MISNIEIVALYLGLNALLLFVLAYNVGWRRSAQKALDPGAVGDAELMRAVRAHANFAEYAPTSLLLLTVLAAAGEPATNLHLFGGIFTAGRVLHAFGMMQAKHPNAPRFIGNLITGLVLLYGAGACIHAYAAPYLN